MIKSEYVIKEFGKNIETYTGEEFIIDKQIGNVYCFPFQVNDESPIAKKYSGHSYGRIEWIIEPREYKWSRSEKRYYVTKLLVWARQTRDLRYYGKIFAIDCFVESLSGDAHKFRPYEGGVLNQIWNIGFSAQTKTPIFSTYPENNFDLLLIKNTSSIAMDIRYLRSDMLPRDYMYYEKIMKLHNSKTTYKD